jgi:hypothetical protein
LYLSSAHFSVRILLTGESSKVNTLCCTTFPIRFLIHVFSALRYVYK